MGRLKKERKADFYRCVNYLKERHNPKLKINCTRWLRIKLSAFDNLTAFQWADRVGQDGWKEVYYMLKRWQG